MSKQSEQIRAEIKKLRKKLALLNPNTKEYQFLLSEIKIRERELKNIAEAKAGKKVN